VTRDSISVTRRGVLRQAFGTCAAITGLSARAQEQIISDHGRIIPPRAVPAIPLLCSNGSTQTLTGLTRGKTTAVQLMFAHCTTTCPIQAAIFQQVQTLLPNSARHPAQLLSISIDPQNDTVQTLREWLHQFQAGNEWVAALPQVKDLAAIQALFGNGQKSLENHTTQVQVLNERSELVWRSIELPSAESVAAVLRGNAG
jgi:protein SCO1